MLLSISTVLYKADVALLAHHVESLFDAFRCAEVHYADLKVQLLLIDNSPASDSSCDQFVAQLPGQYNDDSFQVSYLKSLSNVGYGAANNLALEGQCSDYHLVVNPDVIVTAEALLQSLRYFESSANVGMLTPWVESDSGYGGHVVKRYPDCLTLALRFLGVKLLNRYFSRRLGRYACEELSGSLRQGVEIAGGCFFFIRTDDYLKLNGFDDHYFLYFEDFDFCMRLRELGLSIDYVPSVKINHAGGDVGRKPLIHTWYFILSAVRFFNRNGWKFY